MNINRRTLIKATGAAAFFGHPLTQSWAAVQVDKLVLNAEPQQQLWLPDGDKTKIWGYSQNVIRLQQYQPVAITLHNKLEESTSVHWHGMRVDNAMDGVTGLTQEPVEPGESFVYRLTPKDAGTYWAHAHHNTYRQLALGLYTPVVVAEVKPYPVDQDLLFVADDWLLGRDRQIDTASFEDVHAWAHGGRMGNFLTVNRQNLPEFEVIAGQRIRLRVLNTANSRILNFEFPDVNVMLIAKDGQPLQNPVSLKGVLTLAPAERYDLVVDIPTDTQGLLPIYERSGKQPYLAANWKITGRENIPTLPEVSPLPSNPLPQRDFKVTKKVRLNMEGGAMGRLQAAVYQGKKMSVDELIQNRQAWTFNGVANMPEQPLETLKPGDGVEIELVNDTRWAHAMHLHGHHFLALNDFTDDLIWQDTILVAPGETKTIRFVAESVGRWLLHCHMIEHQVSGMVTYLAVED